WAIAGPGVDLEDLGQGRLPLGFFFEMQRQPDPLADPHLVPSPEDGGIATELSNQGNVVDVASPVDRSRNGRWNALCKRVIGRRIRADAAHRLGLIRC